MKLRGYTIDGKQVDGYHFYCPGCEEAHGFSVTGDHRWEMSGDTENPTVSPSILVQSGHYSDGHSGECWCTYNANRPDDPSGFKCLRCHSFIRNGKIEFLGDCSHKLAGQTVDIPDWPDEY